MGTIIIVLILLIIILTAIKGTLKRILHGSSCCGERDAPEKKVKVTDKKEVFCIMALYMRCVISINHYICYNFFCKMKTETYNELAEINKNKTQWKDKIDFVGSCLNNEDTKVQGKAIWILGEMGFTLGILVQPYVKAIADYLSSDDALLRERALNALGAIKASGFQKEL